MTLVTAKLTRTQRSSYGENRVGGVIGHGVIKCLMCVEERPGQVRICVCNKVPPALKASGKTYDLNASLRKEISAIWVCWSERVVLRHFLCVREKS